jgi:hypothetical protein
VLYNVAEKEGDGSNRGNEAYLNDTEHNCLMNLPFLVVCEEDRVMAQTNAICLRT